MTHVSYFDEVVGWDNLTGGAASLELRDKCMKEEWKELREALDEGDRAHIAKEIADLVWTALGLAWGYGIPFDDVWAEVARSNYSKIGPNGETVRRGDGKIIKPADWIPADISAVLEGAQ